jgi:hypothetical protein
MINRHYFPSLAKLGCRNIPWFLHGVFMAKAEADSTQLLKNLAKRLSIPPEMLRRIFVECALDTAGQAVKCPRAPAAHPRTPRTGRTEQFNARVTMGWLKRFYFLAKRERAKQGELLEAMMEAYESAGTSLQAGHPSEADVQADRTHPLVLWVSEDTAKFVRDQCAERNVSRSSLFEDLMRAQKDGISAKRPVVQTNADSRRQPEA